MSYINFEGVKPFEDWKELKQEGRVRTTIFISLSLAIFFIIFNAIVNVVTMLAGKMRLNTYKSLIVFLIIPLALGIFNACVSVHYVWKINTLLYDIKEKKSEIYKKVYFLNCVIITFTIFLSIGITFSDFILFKISLYELLQMGMCSIFGGALIGYIYYKRSWNEFYERIRSKLNNDITSEKPL